MTAPTVKDHKKEKYVVACIVICIVLIEVTLRIVEDKLSANIANIRTIPATATEIERSEADSILFIGNSLTDNAVDSILVSEHLQKQLSKKFNIFKVIPDSTGIADWYCIYQNQLRNISNPPTVVVIGFAWEQVSDQQPVTPGRLGGFFCKLSDLEPLSATGMGHHQQQLQFAVGAISHVYLNREAIRNRVLDLFIPKYIHISRGMNQYANEKNSSEDPVARTYSYDLLIDLAQQIRDSNSELVIMAMPVIQPYALDPKLTELSSELGITLLDLRNTGDFDKSMYRDPIHLNKEGRTIFSRLIAQNLDHVLKNPRTAGVPAK